ncbi:MAG TPA: hypothetical protein PKL48_14400 [Thermodesulfobacteriota bacterium]|nr:hypothetical protein [Thermodesulfobacteriota bacterium]
MKGYRIETLEQFAEVAGAKKAVLATVTSAGTEIRFPAAFVMNMSAGLVLNMLRRGTWLYVPEKKRGRKEKEKKNDEI